MNLNEAISKFKERNNIKINIPDFIEINLKNKLREYQKDALENFLFFNNQQYLEEINKYEDFEKNNHLLFHMATGSGKTMIMSAIILYFAEKGYNKFIFTTKLDNIIEKTKNNLLIKNNNSKLEFKNIIEINNKKINIREVKNFSKYSNDIEILFLTSTGLHLQINDTRENNITLEDLKNEKIIILADEAHHLQQSTKSELKKIDIEEKNWEDTTSKILNNNKENKLIEFTATMDFNNKYIAEKYRDKIIYDYTLKKFRNEGYSKEISLIKNDDKEKRILCALLVNQLRKEIAYKYNINLNPKILFKCTNTIENLKLEQKIVSNVIEKLNKDILLNFIQENETLLSIRLLKNYLNDNNIEEFISLFKKDFNDTKIISIHSQNNKKEKEEKLKILNNIDNENVRIIFAINILDEGWDVLSLFDIIKLDEISKTTKNIATSEAQLIGRGARIFPYNYKSKDRFKRKFDNDVENELRLLEDMHFYSHNDNNYIKLIKNELIKLGHIDSEESNKIMIKIKNKKMHFLNKVNNIYSNDCINEYDNNSLISNYNINIEITKDFSISEENIINEENNSSNFLNNYNYNIEDFLVKFENIFIISYCLNLNSYYSINNIFSKYRITSKEDLILDIIQLKDKISINLINKKLEDLSFDEKVSIINKFLIILANDLEKKRAIKKGAKTFKLKNKIYETFKDYSKNKENVKEFNEIGIKNEDLFYYDRVSFDSQDELKLFKLFDENLNPEKYLVIRNEVQFKIYNPYTIEDLNNKYISNDSDICDLNGVGFEPDFIILRKDSDNSISQIFIEVKASNLSNINENKWKEKLLIDINNTEQEFIEDSINYKICGIRFFTEKDYENISKSKNYFNLIKE